MNMPIFMPRDLAKYLFHQGHGSYALQAEGLESEMAWQHDGTPFEELRPLAAKSIVAFTAPLTGPFFDGFSAVLVATA